MVPLFAVVSLKDLERPLGRPGVELGPITRADKRFREFIAHCHRAIGAMERLNGRSYWGSLDELRNGGAEAALDQHVIHVHCVGIKYHISCR